ncbi:MAG: VCBS repeat-containing protein [Planctomycetes bacterium]|nr:VCBS repeat-containing protein [Planctomycetota bacterium]
MARGIGYVVAVGCSVVLAVSCGPSIGGLMATKGGGGRETIVVNPTVQVAGVGAYSASSNVSLTSTTTPPGQPLEGQLDGGAWQAVGSPWNLVGLAEGSHTARVRVRGQPDSQQTLTWVVDTIAPAAPSGVTVAATADNLRVSWTAGSDAGSGLLRYTVHYGTAPGDLAEEVTITAPAVAADVPGVVACQRYWVTVTCHDQAGNVSSTTSEVPCRANCGGDGAFLGTAMVLPDFPSVVAQGDFDGDGIVDLVVGSDTQLLVLHGNGSDGRGDGTFALAQTLSAGSSVAEVVVADVDGDRLDDLVILNDTQVRVYLGQGTDGVGNGQFALLGGFSASLSVPEALVVRDFDADGILDIVVGNWGSNSLAVFGGNGSGGVPNGTYSLLGTVATGTAPGAIAVGDFNADGIADLAVACQSGVECLVTHLGNGSDGRGNGTFGAMQTWLSGGFVAGDVLVADHNGDGIDDLVCTLALANAVCFLAGSGSGGRGTGVFYLDEVVGVGVRPWGLAAGEFTGDSRTDFVSFSYLEDGATLLQANGEHGRPDGTYTTSQVGGSGSRLFRGLAADLDGNGSLDLVSTDLDGALLILRANGSRGLGDGTFGDRINDLGILGTGFGVTAGDLDGDRVLDLVVAGFTVPSGGGSDFVTYYQGPEVDGLGTGEFLSGTLQFVGSGPYATVFGDFDRNRISDVAVVCSDLDLRGGGDRVDVLLGDGTNGVGTGGVGSVNSTNVGTTPRGIVAGDFDDDAITDLAVVDNGAGTVTILLGNGTGGRGDGTFTAQTPIAVGTGPMGLTAGDFDADGITDLAVALRAGDGAGSVRVLLGGGTDGAGDGTFTAGGLTSLAGGLYGVTAGDFDADGITDLVVSVYRSVGATSSSGFFVLLGNGSDGRGDGTFTASGEVAAGGNVTAVTAGDWNGDRILDLALARDDATLAILIGNGTAGRGDGTFGVVTSVAIGIAAFGLTNADLDGDGALDLIAVGFEQMAIRFGNRRE